MTGPSPVDRARTGSKHHLITDSGGVPLAITLTGGNRNDVTQLAWHSITRTETARDYERRLLAAFAAHHPGRRPFANLAG